MNFATSGPHRTFLGTATIIVLVLVGSLLVGWRQHFRAAASQQMMLQANARLQTLRDQQVLPVNSMVVAGPGSQKPLNSSLLLADATPLKFNTNAPLVPARTMIESLPMVNAGSVLAEATQIVRKYNDASDWKDRLLYVHEPQRVGKLMENYYEKQRSVDPVMGALMDQGRYKIDGTEIVLLTYRSARLEGKLEVALRPNESGRLVIDWESLVGYSETSFADLMKTKTTTPTLVRALVKLDDYYNYEFSDTKEFLSLKLTAADSDDFVHAYCKRDSIIGRWITEDLGNEVSTSLVKGYTLWVSYPQDAKSNRCLNLVQISAGRWIIVPQK